MTFNEIYKLLEQTGIPKKTVKSNAKLTPPFMVVHEGKRRPIGADLVILGMEHEPFIELYTAASDTTSENTLESLLIEYNLLEEVDEIEIVSSDNLFGTFYQIRTQTDNLEEDF